MTEGSLFAGVMGFGEGFRRAGFESLWAVEKEPFCKAVIRTQFPETELFNDVREVGKSNLRAVDVVTAGFPCQDLSVAGKRAGLAGTRSGLFWEVIRIMGELRPSWLVLENVPGLFSSNSDDEENGVKTMGLDGEWDSLAQTDDFETVITELGKLGVFQSIAWTVLDSQFFGVAQRRCRVFIVCGPRIGSAEQVLFESEGGERDFAPSNQTWEGLANTITEGTGRVDRRGCDDGANIVPSIVSNGDAHSGFRDERGIVTCLESGQANASIGHGIVPNLTCLHEAPIINIQDVRGHRDKKKNGIGISQGEPCYTLDGTSQHAVAFALREYPVGIGQGWNTNFAVASLSGMGSGGPDDNDAQAHRIIECAATDPNRMRTFAELPEGMDSPRYRALGNAVTASVAFWIAERIKAVMTQSPAEVQK